MLALIESDIMAWAKPEYTRGAVDEAGKTYVASGATAEDREMALAVINNWRSSHSYPLNALQVNLRKLAANHDVDPIVAQRIKRLPSIRHKLERFDWLALSTMQDIGGCRAVMSSVAEVESLVNHYTNKSRAKHHLVRHDPYIAQPKRSGYRGVHLVYSYDGQRDWNGLKIEIQLRSRLQHAWATAVETVGTFTRQALKSSQGEAEWLRFFALMSSALALREQTQPVPGTPEDTKALTKELRHLAKKLKVIDRLQWYGVTVEHVARKLEGRGGDFFLLELDLDGSTLRILDFAGAVQANEQYEALERAIAGDSEKDAVLVTVDSITALRRAYPNYFADTSVFAQAVQEAIS